MSKEELEQLLVEYGVTFTDCLADRLLKEFQAKEEINQDLLYENERLIKSVQEIKTEIDERSDIVKRDNIYYAEGLEEALSIIDKHMSWEGEE